MAKVYIDIKTTYKIDKEYCRWQLSLYRYLDGLKYAEKATFNEKDHIYKLGDKALISVTRLLKKHNLATDYSMVNPEILNAKATRGTLIHFEIEKYLETGELGFTPELYAFLEWQKKNNIKVLASESVVNNDLVAGRLDLIAESPNIQSEIMVLHLNGNKCVEYPLELIPDKEIERLLECERNGETYQPKELVIAENAIKELYKVELTLQNLKKKQDEIQAQADEIRNLILKAMKEQGIKSFENDFLKLTYIAPSERETIDTKKLKKDLPEIAQKYSKKISVKETVRITLRGDK